MLHLLCSLEHNICWDFLRQVNRAITYDGQTRFHMGLFAWAVWFSSVCLGQCRVLCLYSGPFWCILNRIRELLIRLPNLYDLPKVHICSACFVKILKLSFEIVWKLVYVVFRKLIFKLLSKYRNVIFQNLKWIFMI